MRSLRSRPPHLGGGRRKIFDLFRGMGQCHFPHVMFRECAAAGAHWRGRYGGLNGRRTKKRGRDNIASRSRLRSTIGNGGLNFSVRNGKRWIPVFITALMSCLQRPAGPRQPFAGYGKKRNIGGNARRDAREGSREDRHSSLFPAAAHDGRPALPGKFGLLVLLGSTPLNDYTCSLSTW